MLYRFIIIVTLGIFNVQYANAQNVIITEIKPLRDTSSSGQQIVLPWLELKNNSGDSVLLSDYAISIDSVTFLQLPDLKLPPFNYFTLWFGNESKEVSNGYILNYEISQDAESIYLIGDGFSIHVKIPEGITTEESYGTYPESADAWIFYPKNFITRGTTNMYPGPWQKVATQTSFSPRDTSPNAAVVYDGKFWIFEGYRYMGSGFHYSISDVYNSVDGINWQPVNPNPPYNPYSAFVVYEGWIWAFEYRAYRTKDGITWEDVGPTPLSLGGRIAVHEQKLFWTSGNDIYTSSDGMFWELLVNGGPWEYRVWPGFQSMNGKLWFFGGGTQSYTTPTSYNYNYYNDVWSSADGQNWELETDSAAFPGRFWFGSHVFDNKLWLLGGYDLNKDINQDPYRGNLNDVWYTEDGINWNQLLTETWPQRHAMFSWVKDNRLFISSGYGKYLLNDVWRFEKEHINDQINSIKDSVFIYGASPLVLPSQTATGQPIAYSASEQSVASVTGNHVEINNAGISVITGKVAPSLFHYGGEFSVPLIVNKKSLAVSVHDTVKKFGDPLPEFELQITGFVKNDDISSLIDVPLISTNADFVSPIGAYTVAPHGGQSNNYEFIYTPGILTIEGGDQMIVFPVPASSLIHINSSNSENLIKNVRLYNSNGNEVISSVINSYFTTLDISSLPSGIYVLVISSTFPKLKAIIKKITVFR